MEQFLIAWLENKMLEVDMCDHRNKVKGLRILELPN
jgi:hypothetical protein